MEENQKEKKKLIIYIAVAYGIMDEKEGIMEDLLFKDKGKNKTFVVKRERKGVKKANIKALIIFKVADFVEL